MESEKLELTSKKKIKCLIISFENILIDYDQFLMECYINTCYEVIGLVLTPIVYHSLFTNNEDEMIKRVLDYYNLQADERSIQFFGSTLQKKLSNKNNLKPKINLINHLELLQKHGVEILIVSRLKVLDFNLLFKTYGLHSEFKQISFIPKDINKFYDYVIELKKNNSFNKNNMYLVVNDKEIIDLFSEKNELNLVSIIDKNITLAKNKNNHKFLSSDEFIAYTNY